MSNQNTSAKNEGNSINIEEISKSIIIHGKMTSKVLTAW